MCTMNTSYWGKVVNGQVRRGGRSLRDGPVRLPPRHARPAGHSPRLGANFDERARRHELLGLRIRRRNTVDQHRAPGPPPKSGGGPHRAIAEDRGQERLARADAKADGLAEAAAVLVSTIGGERFSMTLTGVPSTPDGNAVVESPSFVTRAPVPPDEKTI